MQSQMHNLEENEVKIFLEFDAFQSLLKAITTVELPMGEEWRSYDQWVAKGTVQNQHPLNIALLEHETIDTKMAAFFGSSFLAHFRNYVETKMNAASYFAQLNLLWTHRQHKHAILLTTVIDASESLFSLALMEKLEKEEMIRTGDALYNVSVELEKLGAFENSLANLHTATSFIKLSEPAKSVVMCRRLIEVARKAGQQDLTPNLFQCAAILCQLAQNDETKRLEAFDATENLLRYMLAKKQNLNVEFEEDILTKTEDLFRQNMFLRPLMPLFYIGLELVEVPDDIPDIATLYTAVWDGTFADWSVNFSQKANSLIIDIANKRFELLPKSANIKVFWNDWTIEYKRMLHSIPHNQSLIREEFRDEILMDLKHELIHVYSLFGSVGITLDIMRWLLVELEIMLFVNHHQLTVESPSLGDALQSLLKTDLPVQLTKSNLIALAYAERSAALECKIRCIEEIWTPWFEGIAVFGEGADNPELDAEAESPPTSVITNLVELNLPQEAATSGQDMAKVVVEQMKKMEGLYAEAVKTKGFYRLRTYLTSYHKHYLPGYLCVRSMVSKWRKTYQQPIRGDHAFWLLLHATRFSRYDVLPDLSLPFEDFKKEAMNKHLDWIETMADLDKEILELFLKQDSKQWRRNASWSNGKFTIHGAEWTPEQEAELQWNKARECLSSLTGETAGSDRIPGASSLLKEIVQTIAEASTNRATNPSVITKENAGHILGRYTILPIAKSESPFWLLAQGPRLSCLIRTREKDKEQGNPSYNAVSFRITEEDFAFLKQKITETGVQYLTVTRAVFLGGTEDQSLPHRHFLIYQYGDWMHFESMGLGWQTEVPPEVKGYLHSRFKANLAIRYKETLNSASRPCATRTKRWIEQNRWDSVEVHGASVDAQPWADYVLGLCNEALCNEESTVKMDVAKELLKRIFKSEQQADLLFNEGFNFFEEHDPLLVDRLIGFLFNSARLPERENEALFELDQVINELFGPLLQKDLRTFDTVNF